MVKTRSAGEPGVSLDTHGMRLPPARAQPCVAASVHAKVCRGRVSRRPGVCWDPRSGFSPYGVASYTGHVGCPSPAPAPRGRTPIVPPALCRGRYAGTAFFRGRRGSSQRCSALAMPVATEPQDVGGAALLGWHQYTDSKSEHATDGCLRQTLESGKKSQKPLRGGVCLLTQGVLIKVRRGWALTCPQASYCSGCSRFSAWSISMT